MSQQYNNHDYPLPPPPRSPRHHASLQAGGSVPNTPGSAGPVPRVLNLQRDRPVSAHLPFITTTFLEGQGGGYPSQASTPISGALLTPAAHLPYSPAAHAALNPHTPGGLPPPPRGASPGHSAMEPYNPRQWGHRTQVSGSQMVFQQRQSQTPANTTQMTGMEVDELSSLPSLAVPVLQNSSAQPDGTDHVKAAMPSPPPPYSPATPDNIARAMITSPMSESTGFAAASPLTDNATRNSPQVSVSPAFPPPPPQSGRHRERSASGLSNNRGFFSLSGLRGKQPAQPELHQPQASSSSQVPAFIDVRPPAARRAASTGHMGSSSAIASSSSSAAASIDRSSPENSWQPGMPLPGPPPGPPPPGARSQSLNRPMGISHSGRATPEQRSETTRQRAAAAPSLGAVPPTPANWVDGDSDEVHFEPPANHASSSQSGPNHQPLRIDTGSIRDASLSRRPAKRDTSTQGIRERRSRSRAANGSSDNVSGPSNLVFSPVSGSISRRREHTRTMSGYAAPSSAPSPGMDSAQAKKLSGTIMTPPYTPATGKQAATSGRYIRPPGSASSERPISHLLNTPNEDSSTMPAPLSPARPPTSASIKASPRLDTFALQAIERHRAFVEKEMSAATDEERLELFANFMVHESRLRRDRYSNAYTSMASEILDLTRDMWRSYNSRSSRRAATPSTAMSSIDPTLPSWASDGPPSASSFGDFTPATDSASTGESSEGFKRGDDRQWAESFKPSLSPIPSMAVSTVPDEDSSRGRQPSRWWEASQSGGNSVGRPDRIEKSRRETKYMGVSVAALQASDDDLVRQGTPDSAGQQYMYGPNEYPPEKVGWHDANDFDTPMATPHRLADRAVTPGIDPMDVSRLVTLPPPYPRHHPALSNNHPQLNDLRSDHRLLADHTDIQKIKDSYLDQDFAQLQEQQEAVKKRRAHLRTTIQSKIADGSVSFAEAAEAESTFEAEEAERAKKTARANFDVFETNVSHPLNTLLTERLNKASDSIQQLRVDLENSRDASDPNRAQEEGDEHPERLEKLTLFKWLFEAREQLHKEMFDLHAMRSDKYSEVILTPYRIQKAQSKIDEAVSFFKKDSWERQVTFAKESLKRFEELQSMMETNVSRGVEDQLSAFWDIAPGLLELIQHIPADMSHFDIQIPAQEYEENPSYRAHPLQYLYSLLSHAEKSAYQFIESQTNLLCLLHEVRTATTKSRLRLVEIERNAASPDDAEIYAEMEQARREADDHLTQDLKEKVGEVEAQWQEALGEGMHECKERVSAWLERTGGFDDGLDD